MNKLLIIFLIVFSVNSYAANLQTLDSKMIESAGIPFFSKAVFGGGDKESGFRFATSLPPKEAQKWYRQQLPKWSLYNKYGAWILYDGSLAKGMGDVMSMNHISIEYNENLPQWFSLEKNMTTEIMIMIVK